MLNRQRDVQSRRVMGEVFPVFSRELAPRAEDTCGRMIIRSGDGRNNLQISPAEERRG